MPTLEKFREHIKPAKDLVNLFDLLGNQQRRKAQQRVVERIQALPGVRGTVIDTVRSDQLFMVLMEGDINLHRAAFSPNNPLCQYQ